MAQRQLGCGTALAVVFLAILVFSLFDREPLVAPPSAGSPEPRPAAPPTAAAPVGYQITRQAGIMTFVAVDPAQKDNEDVFRRAAAEICGMRTCQVNFWIGNAPSSIPMTDAQVDETLVIWNMNLTTGFRRWLVNCDATSLFALERECS